MLRNQNQNGMSILELVTASSLLFILSMGMAMFIPANFKLNATNRKKLVSTQLFSEVMETVNSLEFDTLNVNGDSASEQAIPSGEKTLILLDTRKNLVHLDNSTGTPVLTGNTVSIGEGKKQHTYPAYYYINNVGYRVDIKVVKGQYNDLMAYQNTRPDSMLDPLSNYLNPQAFAAPTGSAHIQVNPSSRSGYKNTTAFEFTVNCSHCPSEDRREYNWNFGLGEGSGSSEKSPNNTFSQAGSNKKVFLSITDTQDPNVLITDEVYLDIKDSEVNMEMSPSNPTAGEEVTFSANCINTNTSDCGNTPTFYWNFGDGESGSGNSIKHIYAEAGSYSPSVNVSGGADPTLSQPIQILAKNGQQAFLKVSPFSTGIAGPINAPETTNFTIQTSSTGYDNLNADSITYSIDFGDGTPIVNLIDSSPVDDVFPVSQHKYINGGTYTVTLQVQANNPDDPTQSSITQTSTNISALTSVELTAVSTQIGVAQPLSFSSTAIGAGLMPIFNWDFGDGTTQLGDYSGLATHSYSSPGIYTVTIQVEGGTNPSSSKQITVFNTSGNQSTQQAEMKKVYVSITPWQEKPTSQIKPLSTGTFIKGDNRR